MTRIVIFNDTHLGITKIGALTRCFEKAAREKPDVIVHAGDFCGGRRGFPTLNRTVEVMRKVFKAIPIVTVMGNHDYYCDAESSVSDFVKNYDACLGSFNKHGIHFLDVCGNFRLGNGVVITGASGWYHTRPDSNDWHWIPLYIEGDTHSYILKNQEYIADKNLRDLKPTDTTRIYLSHFPVRDCNSWDGSQRMGDIIEEDYKIDYFLSGHSHGELSGPKHFRTSSDYHKPSFKIIDI